MSERGKNALLVVASIAFCFMLLGLAEAVVRATTDMPFLGHDRGLFTKDRFKDSVGNTPGVTAMSFGEQIYIDADGFRAPANRSGASIDRQRDKTVLVLGDSVAFGPGVPEEMTFVGLLRREFPDRNFLNTAVIGYGPKDYENVFTTLLDRGMTFERALVFFCLNDVSPISGEAIRRSLGDAVTTLRHLALIEEVNAYLRERSKLYLVLKSWMTDPRKRYFLADEAAYGDPAQVEQQLQPIVRMVRLAEARGIPLAVMIVPYAYQMRPEGRTRRKPQLVVSDILRRHKVDHVDLFALVADASAGSADMFLPNDQTHLSKAGHKLLSGYLAGVIRHGRLR